MNTNSKTNNHPKKMLIEEYSDLMGYKEICEDAEYETANFIYMMAGEMNKQDFCKEYKEVGSSPLVLTLAEAANSRDIACRDKVTKERNAAHAILREADGLRAAGHYNSADQLDRIAATLIGRKDCIMWKIYKGFALSETDNEYIKDNLR